MARDTGDNIMRWLDEEPPEWVEAHIVLIDALRDYVITSKALAGDLVLDETITRQQYIAELERIETFASLLTELRSHQIDPTLCGLLR